MFFKWNVHKSLISNFQRKLKAKYRSLTPWQDIIYYPLPPRYIKPLAIIQLSFLEKDQFPLLFLVNVTPFIRRFSYSVAHTSKSVLDDGFIFFRGFLIVFGFDALLSDDEPLWEPIEWSLVQTWLFFILLLAWIGENLISSRYGSYVGRDKRVWVAWYKSFWLIEIWYLVSYGLASLFVIVPFYYEITYSIAFIASWWDWYSRVFIFKFVSLLFLIITIGTLTLFNVRWVSWRKVFLLSACVTCVLSSLFFFQVYTTLFAYFTDPLWYQKTRPNDMVQLSHEPNKWGWGGVKRDHFTYHRVSTVFWFKNDGPFASAFLLINLYFILTLFFSILFWIVLLRKTYYTHEVHYTLLSYTVSSLRQMLYTFLLIYVLIFFSFLIAYWRFPPELLWITASQSWANHLIDVFLSYFT